MSGPHLRTSSLLAVAVSIATFCAVGLPESDGRFGDFVRVVRTGAQRLDSTDSVGHDHEHPESANEAIGAPAASAASLDTSPPALVSRTACIAPPTDWVALPPATADDAPIVRHDRTTFGRAPPAI